MRDHLLRAGLVSALVALVAVTPAAQKTTADALFREALVKERAEGNLREAIFRYERLIAEFGRERQVAAQAMYQLALIYERLGDPRAMMLLARLTRDYGNVEPSASRARERLQALEAAEAGPFPTVTLDPAYGLGSPDGKLVLNIRRGEDPGTRLFVKDLDTGNERLLTEVTTSNVRDCIWSPDSRRLACTHYDQEFKLQEILLIEVASGVTSKLGVTGFVCQWTAAGEIFYDVVDFQRMAADYFLVPVGGGTPRKVHSVLVGSSRYFPAITPDATRLIVSRSNKLHVQEIASGQTQPLTTGTGDETRPIVSPDGRLVAFLANLDGRWALYVAPLDRALPVANPVRVASAENSSLGEGGDNWWTRGGLLTVSQSFSQSDLYRVETDSRTGRATSAPRRLTQDATLNGEPAVSPDGRRVAYWYSRQSTWGLAVMASDGANERPLAEMAGERPYWYSADEILFRPLSATGSEVPLLTIVTLNLQTGALQPIARPMGGFWMYVPARREILYWGPQGGQAKAGITLKSWSLAEGKDRVVAQIDYLWGPGALTPDGRLLAYVTGRPVPGSNRRLYQLALMSLDGKQEGTLIPEQPRDLGAWAFSPNGRLLLYWQEGNGLNVMNVATRESWPLFANPDEQLWSARAYRASWSPDGTFIVVGRGEPSRRGRLAWEGVTAEAVAKLMSRVAKAPRKRP